MGDITIEVDGLPVDVDATAYGADPDGTIAKVRAARAAVRMPDLPPGEDPEPDYKTLYGEDG